MKRRMLTAAILAGTLSVFAVGGAVVQGEGQSEEQRGEQHPENQTTQAQPKMMGGEMMGMMSMMGHMGQVMTQHHDRMMTQHQQMTGNMDKLMQSMAAIENEKDPDKMKSMMAEHQALLGEMRSQMMQQGGMMQTTGGMMMRMPGMMMQNCPLPGNSSPPSSTEIE